MAHSAGGSELQTDALALLVDADGILRPDALAPPDPASALRVFSQGPDSRVDLHAWQKNAEAFFQTRLSSTLRKRYPLGYPAVDADAILVTPPDGAGASVRLCYGRPRTAEELAAAEDADTRAGGTGLGLLARRCPSVWLVGRIGEAEDRTALLLSAIVASVVLGPILTPEGELFGVKTARAKLTTPEGPYR